MRQLRIWRKEHMPSGRLQLHTVVDVIVRHRQRLLHSGDLLIDRLSGHHAGRSHGTVVLYGYEPPCIAISLPVCTDKKMARHTAQPEHDAGMLNRPVRIIELCSDRTDFVLLTKSQQLLDPAFASHFGIIVQQDQVLTVCLRHCKIVDRRIVKAARIPQNPKSAIRLLPQQTLIIRLCLCLHTIIFNYENLIIRIRRLLPDRSKTAPQVFHMVLIRDQDRDKRHSLNRKLTAVSPTHRSLLCPSCDPAPLIVCFDCPSPCLKRILLALGVACRRCRMCPPVVEHLRNMADRLRLFRTAQHKVIVLRTVIGRIQQPDLLQQIASHRK